MKNYYLTKINIMKTNEKDYQMTEEEMARLDEAVEHDQETYGEGYEEGHEKGYEEGREKGYANGIEKGYANGIEKGYANGI